MITANEPRRTHPDRSLRITFLNSWHTDRVRGSGTTTAIETFAIGLRTHGHEVETLAVNTKTGRSTGRSTAPSFIQLPLIAQRALYNARASRTLSNTSGPTPDVVVGFDVDGVCLTKKRRPFLYVVALKGVAADEARFERGWPRIQLNALGRVERRNALGADLIIVPSQYSAEVVSRLYGAEPDRIAIVPEAIDPEPWRILRRDQRPRTHPRPTVLTVGRQYPRKNTARLIEAMTHVRRHIPDVQLRIIGGGPCLPDLRNLTEKLGLQSTVSVEGAVAGTDAVRRAYFEADVFSMPSLQEGFGIVFLEAMAAGLPVVAGQSGAAPEVIVDGETGILTDPMSPEAIAQGLVTLLNSPARRRQMGTRGIERAEQFTPESIATTFLEQISHA